MAKFYVGQKVLVKNCSCGNPPPVESMLGKICEIKSIGTDIMVYQEDKKDAWYFKPSDLEPITETPNEITVNGVTYVRKSEPEHEWKFGDVAVHKDYGVGIVFGVAKDGEVCFKEALTLRMLWRDTSKLTFLRRTDFSV